jgi:hypothetical protein
MVVAAPVVGVPTTVHASGDQIRLSFQLGLVIIGMHASYSHMAAGTHYLVG